MWDGLGLFSGALEQSARQEDGVESGDKWRWKETDPLKNGTGTGTETNRSSELLFFLILWWLGKLGLVCGLN